jgi:hypothetical protein
MSETAHKLRPPNTTETVLCAIARIGGKVLYYGRGVVSGDWYVGLEWDDPEFLQAGLEEAEAEGERGMWHPCGLPMVRIDWLSSDDRYPEDREHAEQLKKLLERVPPQSHS